jgi:hypothetical protein
VEAEALAGGAIHAAGFACGLVAVAGRNAASGLHNGSMRRSRACHGGDVMSRVRRARDDRVREHPLALVPDSHKAGDGKTINQDCEACHAILAIGAANPRISLDLEIH